MPVFGQFNMKWISISEFKPFVFWDKIWWDFSIEIARLEFLLRFDVNMSEGTARTYQNDTEVFKGG